MTTHTRTRPLLLAGLTHGWSTWFEMMARSQDFSAPWKSDAGQHARAWAEQRRTIGPFESQCSAK